MKARSTHMDRFRPLMVALLVACASSSARAEDPAGVAASEILSRAEQECAELDYELCAESAMTVAVDETATVDERTRARFIAGSAQRVMGKDVDARLTFRALLLEAPDFAPPADTPAKISQFFALVQTEVADERARASMPAPEAPPRTSLVVESVPSGAHVTVDGVARGTTPLRLDDVAVGLREVVVSSSDWRDVVTVPVDVVAGGPTSVRARFRQLEELAPPVVDDEEGAPEPPATWSSAASKAALGVGALASGCALGCASFVVTIMVSSFMNVVDIGVVGYPLCFGLWTVGLIGAGGLFAWAGIDLIEAAEAPSQRLLHIVSIVPPTGGGEEKTLTFPVDETSY